MSALLLPDIRVLSSCSFATALKAWNEGFAGYPIDMTLSLDGYITRLRNEGLSPEHSLIAFSEGQPVGFLLNGIRNIAGRKVAWNGGTGVSASFRRHGIGRALMSATLDLYREREVAMAMLEALSGNERAISLYRQYGYDVTDHLVFLQKEDELHIPNLGSGTNQFQVKQVAPYVASNLDFYDATAPWQGQWESINSNCGEALLVMDSSGLEVAYAFYKKRLDEKGSLQAIVLHQCAVRPNRADEKAIAIAALSQVYQPFELPCRRMTHNLSKSNEIVITVLKEWGFYEVLEQVQMITIL